MNLKIIKKNTGILYMEMLKTIVEFKFDDYQLYDHQQKTEIR